VAINRADSSSSIDIWVTDLARKSPTRLTFDPGIHVSPAWSPDGKRLAFLNLGSQTGVRIVDVNDSAKSQPLGVALGPSSWSPDGQYLLGIAQAGEMTLIPLAGNGKPILVGSPNGHSFQAQFSPDGKYIAFTSDQSGRNEVYVQPMPPGTGQQKVSINGGSAPRWRHDGKELFFASLEGAMMAVDVKLGAAFSAEIPHQLFQIQGVDLTATGPTSAIHYDVRGDGQQFLVFAPQKDSQDSVITVVLNWWAELGK
jgi:Tol biopolymer transport system component